MVALLRAVKDAVTGIAANYAQTTVGLAKIQAAEYYLKGVQAAQKTSVVLVHAAFGLLVAGSLFLILEFAILVHAPAEVPARIGIAVAAAFLYWGMFYAAALYFVSQKKWMRYTKSDRMVKLALNGSARN